MRTALLIISLTLPSWLFASEVYKTVEPDGSVIYSDHPDQDATPITIEPAPGLPPLPPSGQSQQSQTPPVLEQEVQDGATLEYQSLEILAPVEDSVVRDNAGNVVITVQIQPALQVKAGHRLAVVLDGSRLEGRFTGDRFSLSNVERGSHSVEVQVVDEHGNALLRSAPRSFHMKRHSILNP